jgi:hypothetical protein
VVVLVPSDRAAAAWEPYAHHIWRVGDLEAGGRNSRPATSVWWCWSTSTTASTSRPVPAVC